ncbi:MAG: VOC family protein [Pirellulales bacterium]|nr:VOC family protein [Pirellulales bacterium]
MLTPFHHAFPVRDIEEARDFYGQVLGLTEGRSDATWIDFDLFGHQIVAHEKANLKNAPDPIHSNPVDGHDVPVPHFGVVLEMKDWQRLADRLKEKSVHFVIEPYIRFAGEVGEQATMFFLDPSGNALEFKAFKDMGQIFAK